MAATEKRKSSTRLIVVLTIIIVAFFLLPVLRFALFPFDIVDKAPVTDTLKIGFYGKIDSLNPLICQGRPAKLMMSLLYDGLMGVGESLDPVPNLAVGCMPVPETDVELVNSGAPFGSVWEYNLSTKAKWHDGVNFSADDVVFTVNLFAGNASLAWMFEPYVRFIKDAVKVDSDKVRVHFWDRATGVSIPVAFGDRLSFPILPEHVLGNRSATDLAFWTGVTPWTDPPIVGTGPFKATAGVYNDWVHDGSAKLVRNQDLHLIDYRHGVFHPHNDVDIAKLFIMCFDDSTAMAYALEHRQLDVANFPSEVYGAVRDSVASGQFKNILTYDGISPDGRVDFVSFDMTNDSNTNGARLDPSVRQAMLMATDRQQLIGDCYAGFAEPGSTIVPPGETSGHWHHELLPNETLAFNITRANELLNSSGYPVPVSGIVRVANESSLAVRKGWVANGTELKFNMVYFREEPEHAQLASSLKVAWAKIGVDLVPVNLSTTILPTINWIYGYRSDLILFRSYSDPDPQSPLYPQSMNAWTTWSENHYFNESFENSFNASVSAIDYGERKAAVDECQLIHYRDVGRIVLAYPHECMGFRNDTWQGWGNWTEHPGLSVNAVWGSNPLYIDLEPVARSTSALSSEFALTLALVAVGVAVAVVAMFLLRRRRKGEPRMGP